jgi:hypothetical protein
VLALEARALLSTLTVTNDNDSGTGSLRAQLAAAHAGDTVKFAPSAYGTIALTSGPLQVATSVTIQGPGAKKVTVSGGGQSDVFEVQGGVTATISGLTVADGFYSVPDGFRAGGISNLGTLTLSRDVVADNSSAPGSYSAGGIFNQGTLTIDHSTISGNSGTFGGGINNDGPLTITDSTLSGNSSPGDGAGLYTFASASLTRCSVSGNTGVGISVFSGYGYAISQLTVTNCTISGNTNHQSQGGFSLALGAGIAAFDSAVTVTSSTITGNTATGSEAFGAAIFMGGFSQSPQRVLTIVNSTISGNQAIGAGSDGFAYGGAIHSDPGATLSISGSSFVNNFASASVESRGGAMDLGGLSPSTITACQFTGNQAVQPSGTSSLGGSATGGAIANTGSAFPPAGVLTISSSSFTDNSAQSGTGSGFGLGGAIINQASGAMLTLSSDLFLGNDAAGGPAAPAAGDNFGGFGAGGALVNFIGATATISNSSFFFDTAAGGSAAGSGSQAGPGEGGAIQNAFATMTVADSTLIGNVATGGAGTNGAVGGNGQGGGIQDMGPLQVGGGLISGNQAVGGSGGGDSESGGAYVSGSGASISFTDVLITLNAATGGAGGGSGFGGGLYIGTGAITTLKNTKVFGNIASTAGNDIYGTYTTG